MSKDTGQIGEDSDFEKIRLDEIDKGPAYIRTHVNKEALDELKDSIKKIGLLQPIVVMRKQKPKAGERAYSLVVGSRRVQAHEELAKKDILAVIVDEQNRERILAASLAENMFRSKLSVKDTAKAVTELYKLYGKKVNKVAKATGMWPETVLRYVYLEEYGTEKMVSWVQKKQLALVDVKKILQIAQWNISKAEKMLEVMIKEGMTRTRKKNFAEFMKANPTASITEGVKDSEKPHIQKRLSVDLPLEVQNGIAKAVEDWGIDAEEVALQALQDWLEEQGYIE